MHYKKIVQGLSLFITFFAPMTSLRAMKRKIQDITSFTEKNVAIAPKAPILPKIIWSTTFVPRQTNATDTCKNYINSCIQSQINLNHTIELHDQFRNETQPISLLSYAAYLDSTSLVKLLLEHGASPDFAGPTEISPLFYAVWNGNCEVIKLLLNAGANPNQTEPSTGISALIFASLYEPFKAFTMLQAFLSNSKAKIFINQIISSQNSKWHGKNLLDILIEKQDDEQNPKREKLIQALKNIGARIKSELQLSHPEPQEELLFLPEDLEFL